MRLDKELAPIKTRGGHRPGAGRPFGSLNRLTRPIKELSSQYGPEALDILVDIMQNGESEQARIAAAKELLDRGYGKPRQNLEVSQEDKVEIVVLDLDGAQLRQYREWQRLGMPTQALAEGNE